MKNGQNAKIYRRQTVSTSSAWKKERDLSATQLLQNIYTIQNHLQSSSSNVDNMEDNIVVRERLLPDFDRVTSPYHS